MPKVQVVLFDNDGTLVDTFDAIQESMHYTMITVLGHDIPDEELLHMVGRPLVEQMEYFADDPSQVDTLVRTYREHNERDLFEKTGSFEGVKEVLQQLLNQGFRLGVVSSKRQRVVVEGLRCQGLDRYFEMIDGVEQCFAHKPNPAPLIDAAERMGVEPWQCMYVGDSPYDLQAAHRAGMKSVAVTWGKFFSGSDLVKEEPTVIVTDPSKLLDAIGFAAI